MGFADQQVDIWAPNAYSCYEMFNMRPVILIQQA